MVAKDSIAPEAGSEKSVPFYERENLLSALLKPALGKFYVTYAPWIRLLHDFGESMSACFPLP